MDKKGIDTRFAQCLVIMLLNRIKCSKHGRLKVHFACNIAKMCILITVFLNLRSHFSLSKKNNRVAIVRENREVPDNFEKTRKMTKV